MPPIVRAEIFPSPLAGAGTSYVHTSPSWGGRRASARRVGGHSAFTSPGSALASLALRERVILRWPLSLPRRMAPNRHPSRLAPLAPQDDLARLATLCPRGRGNSDRSYRPLVGRSARSARRVGGRAAVIPAKAGIQNRNARRFLRWIPACAGMTHTNHFFPSPLVGEGFPPRSCASAALRKSHGGKGEGAFSLTPLRGLPLTASAKTRSRALPLGESEKNTKAEVRL